MRVIFKRVLRDLRRGWEAPAMLTAIFLAMHFTIAPPHTMTVPGFLIALVGGTALGLLFYEVSGRPNWTERQARRSSTRQ